MDAVDAVGAMGTSRTLETNLTHEEARALLERHNTDPYHLRHAEILEALMRHFAAAILVRPSKSVADMSLKSLRKKFRQRSFAAGCSRDDIALGAELNDLSVDELLALGLDAMKAVHAAGGPVD